MNIVYSSSDLYCECTCISLISLFETNAHIRDINVFILSTDISDSNKEYLIKIAKQYNREIKIIDAKEDFIKGAEKYELELLRGAYNTYSRIMLNAWFNDLDRIIVIDSDTLVLNDISEMWSINLAGKLLAAVPEIGVYSKHNTIEDKELLSTLPLYYNMGIIVVNLSEWRNRKIDDFLISSIKNDHFKNKVADQSIINRYLNSFIVRMNLRYNFYSPIHGTSFKRINKVFCEKHIFNEKEIADAQLKPAIIHFYGHSYERPWFKHSASIFKKKYLSFRNKTKWKKEPMQKWRKSPNCIFKLYDLACFFMLKMHLYNSCLSFRYVFGQKMKGKTKLKR